MRYLLSLSVALGLALSHSFVQAGENDDRVVTYLISADELIADAKHIVVDLAKEKKAWEESVLPNLEIWLFGVERSKPVGLDVLFDPQTGRALEFHVPIENRKTFLNSNLGDVGVVTKQDRKNRDLYELSDVLEGWLLFTKSPEGQEYGSIVTNKSNLPTKSPTGKFEVFRKAGYEAGLRWVALEGTRSERDKGFQKMLSEVTSTIKKRPEESAAQFELRKLTVEQNANRLARMLSNTSELMAGWSTDVKGKKYGGSSTMTGLPGTDVEKNIQSMGTVPSKFASVKTPDNSAMSARVMLPIAEVYQKEQALWYAASLKTLKERIDGKDDISADEKTARKTMSEKINKLLTDGLGLGWVDVYAELVASGPLYNGVFGVRVQDSAIAREIVELLPKSQKDWAIKLDAAEESGTKIHLIDMKGKLPATLKTYFGESGEGYLATGEQTVWLAAGPDALERLKAAIKASSVEGKADNSPVKVVMHVHPALQIGKSLSEDRDIELFRSLKDGWMMKGGQSSSAEEKPGKKKDEERRVNRNALQNFKWHDTAIKALEGGKDVVTLEVKKDGTALLGELKAEEGVMTAIGKVIAKFAVEMLQ